eukprot:TRINITY_DN25937_c0_g1_i1.p1 TRINITY_DN25937_c0_g1~~TRINITY_DN25937_c0_g1_i1.p1  ORF type:complete len:277 (+),score=17.70 TRINITY_DN25937_c0_g1_i1:134-964(+)
MSAPELSPSHLSEPEDCQSTSMADAGVQGGCYIGLIFENRFVETRPGESVSVVGSGRELSSWDPYDRHREKLQLMTDARTYPQWLMPVPVWLQIDQGEENRALAPDSRCDSIANSNLEDTILESLPNSWPNSPQVSQSSGNSELTQGPAPDFVRIEYKYVKGRQVAAGGGVSIQWEDHIANRRADIPRDHGSIWVISDHKFNDARPPVITRTTLAEVLHRRESLDPEWTQRRHPALDPEWSGADFDGVSNPESRLTVLSHDTTSTLALFRFDSARG